MSLLPLIVVSITIWLVIDALKHKVAALQLRVDHLDELRARLASLQMRVETLEAGLAPRTLPAARPPAAAAPAPIPVPADPAAAPPAPMPTPPALPPNVVVPPLPPKVFSEPAMAPVVAARVPLAVPAPSVTTTASVPEETQPEAWEVVVGTSWLNKIGVFVFVLGLALLVGYSFTRIGPAGRVVVAYLVGGSMLATGIALEKRRGFANYAYGLIAGGWAAVYFTTYATHAVPQAKLVDSDLVGALALAGVAVAMIAHSIKYKSETLTAMAYVVGFGTLTLTPLSGFSFVASVPLTVSLVVVAYRFGWDRMVLVGLVSTYGLFTIRESFFPNTWLDPQSAARYLALGIYWLVFETADIARLRSADPDAAPTPLVAVNAAAFAGATLLQAPEDPALLTNILGAMGMAYLASAVTRRLLIPQTDAVVGPEAVMPFTSSHSALAIAATLMGWLLHRRFSGVRETLALVFEVEVLFAAGLAMRDRWVREVSAAAMLAAVVATGWLVLGAVDAARHWPWTMYVSTPAVALVALVMVCNREWLAHRRLDTLVIERAYSWLAFFGVAFVLARECDPAWLGIAGLALALVLVEPGVRGRADYGAQAIVAAVLSSGQVLSYFVLDPDKALPVSLAWRAIPVAIILAGAFAARVRRAERSATVSESLVLAGTLMSAVTPTLLAVLEWRVVPEAWVPVAWGLTGAGLVVIGYLINRPEQRWVGYTMAGVAAGAVGIPLWQSTPDSSTRLVAAAAVAAALYSISGGTRHLSRGGSGREEDTAAVVVSSSLATLLVVLIEWRSVPVDRLALTWTATAAVLLAFGFWRRAAADLRAQAAVLLALGIGRQTSVLLDGAVGSLLWAWAEVLLVYGLALASRYRSRWSIGDPAVQADDTMRVALFLAGALLLTLVVHEQVTPEWLVPAWGVQGVALLFSGFFLRERVLRLSGLGLLFLCVARLGYDIRSLDALGRIISFVVLGLVLLAVSWTYTKFKDQMKRWL